MAKTSRILVTAVAFAAAVVMLVPGTGSGAAAPRGTSSTSPASPGIVKWRFQVSGQYFAAQACGWPRRRSRGCELLRGRVLADRQRSSPMGRPVGGTFRRPLHRA